jgi:hypothetical protein
MGKTYKVKITISKIVLLEQSNLLIVISDAGKRIQGLEFFISDRQIAIKAWEKHTESNSPSSKLVENVYN